MGSGLVRRVRPRINPQSANQLRTLEAPVRAAACVTEYRWMQRGRQIRYSVKGQKGYNLADEGLQKARVSAGR